MEKFVVVVEDEEEKVPEMKIEYLVTDDEEGTKTEEEEVDVRK